MKKFNYFNILIILIVKTISINTFLERLEQCKYQGMTDEQLAKYVVGLKLATLKKGEIDKYEHIGRYTAASLTVLHYAAFIGYEKTFKTLLAYGANPEIDYIDVQFSGETQRIEAKNINFESEIRRRGRLSSVESIKSETAQSMLKALSVRRNDLGCFLFSCCSSDWDKKTPEERAALLGITLASANASSKL